MLAMAQVLGYQVMNYTLDGIKTSEGRHLLYLRKISSSCL